MRRASPIHCRNVSRGVRPLARLSPFASLAQFAYDRSSQEVVTWIFENQEKVEGVDKGTYTLKEEDAKDWLGDDKLRKMDVGNLLFKHKTELKLEYLENKKLQSVSDFSYAFITAGANERTELLQNLTGDPTFKHKVRQIARADLLSIVDSVVKKSLIEMLAKSAAAPSDTPNSAASGNKKRKADTLSDSDDDSDDSEDTAPVASASSMQALQKYKSTSPPASPPGSPQ